MWNPSKLSSIYNFILYMPHVRTKILCKTEPFNRQVIRMISWHLNKWCKMKAEFKEKHMGTGTNDSPCHKKLAHPRNFEIINQKIHLWMNCFEIFICSIQRIKPITWYHFGIQAKEKKMANVVIYSLLHVWVYRWKSWPPSEKIWVWVVKRGFKSIPHILK